LFVGLNLRDAQVRRADGAATAADGEHREVARQS
jgi:hypothetical protein